jgi:hypothetical protein
MGKLVQTVVDISIALWGSFRGYDASYYPRREKVGTVGGEKIDTEEMLAAIREAVKGFKFDANELSKADPKLLLDRAKDSLEESKKQTEYQDAKAGRLLTIVAFLTAAVGTVFGKFIDLYPLHSGTMPASQTSLWVIVTYLCFGVYLLLVAAGALVSFHAMSTRFVWPTDSNFADKGDVGSVLFWQQIIRTRPEAWGSLFAGDKGELLRKYYANYVAEAYLIATKVADKLRYLDPGQRLLIASIRVLLGLFLLIILTFTLVSPPPKATAAGQVVPGKTASVPDAPAVVLPGTTPPVANKAAPGNQQPPAASSAAAEAATAVMSQAGASATSPKK